MISILSWFNRRDDRIRELEDRLTELQLRSMSAHGIHSMLAGLVLAVLPKEDIDTVMRDLRERLLIDATSPSPLTDVLTLRLRAEEYASALLDQIERVARIAQENTCSSGS